MPEASPSISGWTTQDVSVFDGSGTCPHVLPGSKPLNPPLTCSPPPTLRLVPTLCHLSALAGFLLRFCCSLGKVVTLNQRVHRTRVETWETWVQSLGWEEPLKKEMATHSSSLDGKSYGQRSRMGLSPWDCKESDMA